MITALGTSTRPSKGPSGRSSLARLHPPTRLVTWTLYSIIHHLQLRQTPYQTLGALKESKIGDRG